MTPAEKQAFADEASKAADHPIVQNILDEARDNLSRNHKVSADIVEWQVAKVANVVAQVARAQALGIDPDELRR